MENRGCIGITFVEALRKNGQQEILFAFMYIICFFLMKSLEHLSIMIPHPKRRVRHLCRPVFARRRALAGGTGVAQIDRELRRRSQCLEPQVESLQGTDGVFVASFLGERRN